MLRTSRSANRSGGTQEPDRTESGRSDPSTRNLGRNLSWILSSNVLYAASQWGVIVALAQTGGPVTVGQFAFALAVAAPIFLFFDMNLRVVMTTNATRDHRLGSYFRVRSVSIPLATLTSLTVAAILGADRSQLLVTLVVALSKAIESMSNVCYGIWQRSERHDLVAKSVIATGGFGFISVLVGMAVFDDLVIALSLYALAWFGVLALFDWPTGHRMDRSVAAETALVRPNVEPPQLSIRTLASIALPLGVAAGANSLTTNIPRFFVEAMEGAAELGVFATIFYVVSIVGVVTSSLSAAAVPRLARHFQADDMAGFRQLAAKVFGAGLAVGTIGLVAAWAIGEDFLRIAYGDAFVDGSTLIATMFAAIALTQFRLAAAALQATQRYSRYLSIMVPVLVLVTASSPLLINAAGITGAAVAVAGSYGLGVAMLIWQLWRLTAPRPHQ